MSEEGKIYECKTCRREIARGEVVNCEICLKKQCPNCIVEIAGKKMCQSCKEWALAKLKANEKLEIDESLFPDIASRRKQMRKELENRIKETAGDVTGKPMLVKASQPSSHKAALGMIGLCIGALMLYSFIDQWNYLKEDPAFLIMPLGIIGMGIGGLVAHYIEKRRWISSIYLNEEGLEISRNFERIQIRWADIKIVYVGMLYFRIKYENKELKVRQMDFPSYGGLLSRIRKVCKENKIEVIE